MDERPAINASPLIYLARADLLPLLQVVASEHVIPSSVWQELRASRSDTATIERVQDGVISLARPVLEVLRNHGMYLSDRVLNQALSLVNE